MLKIDFLIAFLGGMFSIFSPCILPVLPSFLGYITGVSLHQQQNRKAHFGTLISHTAIFALGFLITFLIFGAVIGWLGSFLVMQQELLQKIGGVLIILFGLMSLGVIKLKFLSAQHQLHLTSVHSQRLKSFLTGIIFAFSWTPCYGPILGSIFTLAASSVSFWTSIWLFFFYSLGFLIPLMIFTVAIYHGSNLIAKNRYLIQYAHLLAGILLILVGILLLTNQMSGLVNWLSQIYISLGLEKFT